MKKLHITAHAEKQLSKLPKSEIKKILIKLNQALDDIDKLDIKKLRGYENTWRIRIGNYRAIIVNDRNLLIVKEIGHRKDIYK